MPNLLSFTWKRPVAPMVDVRSLAPHVTISSGRNGKATGIRPKDGAPEWVADYLLRYYGNIYSVGDSNLPRNPTGTDLGFLLEELREPGFLAVSLSRGFEEYNLFEEYPGAFMEFSEIDKNWKGVKEFYYKYGPLNMREELWGSWPIFSKYSYESYKLTAEAMEEAVRAWRPVEGKPDYKKLAAFFREEFEGSDPLGRIAPRIKTLSSGHPPELHLVPSSLSAALWVQFALAVTSSVNLRRCAVCPSWFTFGSGTGRRKSAHYCSDRCRKAAHEQRRHARDGHEDLAYSSK